MVGLEDYLKVIYVLSRTSSDAVRTSDIAKKMMITRGAVTLMVKKLATKGYLDYSRYQGVVLTKKGQDIGHSMLRRHRLIELYLNQKLGVSPDAVHVEAEALEHAMSDYLVDKIDVALDFPKFDPHGDPIPQKDGSFPSHQDVKQLAQCNVNEIGKIVRISCDDQAFLQYLQSHYINLNQTVVIRQCYDFDHSVDVMVNQAEHHLTSFDCQHIWVVPEKGEIKI